MLCNLTCVCKVFCLMSVCVSISIVCVCEVNVIMSQMDKSIQLQTRRRQIQAVVYLRQKWPWYISANLIFIIKSQEKANFRPETAVVDLDRKPRYNFIFRIKVPKKAAVALYRIN